MGIYKDLMESAFKKVAKANHAMAKKSNSKKWKWEDRDDFIEDFISSSDLPPRQAHEAAVRALNYANKSDFREYHESTAPSAYADFITNQMNEGQMRNQRLLKSLNKDSAKNSEAPFGSEGHATWNRMQDALRKGLRTRSASAARRGGLSRTAARDYGSGKPVSAGAEHLVKKALRKFETNRTATRAALKKSGVPIKRMGSGADEHSLRGGH